MSELNWMNVWRWPMNYYSSSMELVNGSAESRHAHADWLTHWSSLRRRRCSPRFHVHCDQLIGTKVFFFLHSDLPPLNSSCLTVTTFLMIPSICSSLWIRIFFFCFPAFLFIYPSSSLLLRSWIFLFTMLLVSLFFFSSFLLSFILHLLFLMFRIFHGFFLLFCSVCLIVSPVCILPFCRHSFLKFGCFHSVRMLIVSVWILNHSLHFLVFLLMLQVLNSLSEFGLIRCFLISILRTWSHHSPYVSSAHLLLNWSLGSFLKISLLFLASWSSQFRFSPSIRMLLILSNFVFVTCFFFYNVSDSGKYFLVAFLASSCLEFSLSWQPQVLSLKDYLEGQGKLWPLHSLLSIHLLKWKNRYIKLIF